MYSKEEILKDLNHTYLYGLNNKKYIKYALFSFDYESATFSYENKMSRVFCDTIDQKIDECNTKSMEFNLDFDKPASLIYLDTFLIFENVINKGGGNKESRRTQYTISEKISVNSNIYGIVIYTESMMPPVIRMFSKPCDNEEEWLDLISERDDIIFDSSRANMSKYEYTEIEHMQNAPINIPETANKILSLSLADKEEVELSEDGDVIKYYSPITKISFEKKFREFDYDTCIGGHDAITKFDNEIIVFERKVSMLILSKNIIHDYIITVDFKSSPNVSTRIEFGNGFSYNSFNKVIYDVIDLENLNCKSAYIKNGICEEHETTISNEDLFNLKIIVNDFIKEIESNGIDIAYINKFKNIGHKNAKNNSSNIHCSRNIGIYTLEEDGRETVTFNDANNNPVFYYTKIIDEDESSFSIYCNNNSNTIYNFNVSAEINKYIDYWKLPPLMYRDNDIFVEIHNAEFVYDMRSIIKNKEEIYLRNELGVPYLLKGAKLKK